MRPQSLKKLLVFLGTLILLLFVLLYFVFSSIKSKNENTALLEKELSVEDTKDAYLTSLRRTIKNIDSDIALVDSSIVASDGDVAFIEDFESLARGYGLDISIDSLRFDTDKDISDTMVLFKISAKTKGNWAGTYQFASALESLPFQVKMNNLSLSKVVQDDPQTKKRVSFWQGDVELAVLKYK